MIFKHFFAILSQKVKKTAVFKMLSIEKNYSKGERWLKFDESF